MTNTKMEIIEFIENGLLIDHNNEENIMLGLKILQDITPEDLKFGNKSKLIQKLKKIKKSNSNFEEDYQEYQEILTKFGLLNDLQSPTQP